MDNLREKIKEIITTAYYPYGREIAPIHTKVVIDSILLEVEKYFREAISLCRDEFNNHTESAEEIENKIVNLLEELKGEK